MTLFKSYTFTWWQIGIFKLALLSIGAIIGAYGQNFFMANIPFVAIVAGVSSAYVLYVAIKQ